MPSSARCFMTMCVMQRVDLGIDPYGFGLKCILRQSKMHFETVSSIYGKEPEICVKIKEIRAD